MKISKVTIKGFRSIEGETIDFSDFNIIVGKNNCGKTNLFEAIQWFYSGFKTGVVQDHFKYDRNPSVEIIVDVEFTGAQDGLSRMAEASNKTKLKGHIGDSDTVTIRRSSSTPSKRRLLIDGEFKEHGLGADKVLNEFLPKFEYVHTKQYHDSVAKYTKTTPIGIMLSGVLSEILERDDDYKEFKEKFDKLFGDADSAVKKEFDKLSDKVKVYLAKQFSECNKVGFEVEEPLFEDLLKKFTTSIDDGVETSAEEKGDGMQRALMLAIIQTYAEYRKELEDGSKSFLFFIDEAELHLHPSAQRNLKDVLLTLSQENDQVFINTHSSVFLSDDDDGQIILKAEKENKKTTFEPATESEKPGIVYDLLGGSPTDMLLPNNFLLVEGVSEYEFITRVIGRFYSDQKTIQIIKCNGDVDQAERSINAVEKVFSVLDESIYTEQMVVLMDQPSTAKEGGYNDFISKRREHYGRGQFFTLPVGSLEEYYPDHADETYTNWRKNSDEVKEMSGKQKRQLAKYVGDQISKDEFESDMILVHQALEYAWSKAY